MGRGSEAWKAAAWSVLEGHPLAIDGRMVLGLVTPRMPLGLRLLLVLEASGEPAAWRLQAINVEGDALATMEGLAAIRRLPPIATLMESAVAVADAFGGQGQTVGDYVQRAKVAMLDASRHDEFLEALEFLVALGEVVAPARPIAWAADELGVHPTSVSRWRREIRERGKDG